MLDDLGIADIEMHLLVSLTGRRRELVSRLEALKIEREMLDHEISRWQHFHEVEADGSITRTQDFFEEIGA